MLEPGCSIVAVFTHGVGKARIRFPAARQKLRRLNKKQKIDFQRTIRSFYRKHARKMPWRGEADPYKVLVSEIMLQQTQVSRVLVKYSEFLKRFPNFKSLARANLKDVLVGWFPLGYNRRAKYLLEIAKIVVESYQGFLPEDPLILETFPGLGKATARSVVAFAWNKPVVFIETNIRRVFIHHFFANKKDIKDKDILLFVEGTLPKRNVKDWYYALMDYGAYLGTQENVNKRSFHYRKQSKFRGSNREVRGFLLKILSNGNSFEMKALIRDMPFSKVRVQEAVKNLKKEGIVGELKGKIFIA